jgi:hypothetical protein
MNDRAIVVPVAATAAHHAAAKAHTLAGTNGPEPTACCNRGYPPCAWHARQRKAQRATQAADRAADGMAPVPSAQAAREASRIGDHLAAAAHHLAAAREWAKDAIRTAEGIVATLAGGVPEDADADATALLAVAWDAWASGRPHVAATTAAFAAIVAEMED